MIHYVWNDLTQATDFEGTKSECQEYVRANGTGELSVMEALPTQRVEAPRASQHRDARRELEAAKKQLAGHEATLAEVQAGRIPAHLRSPGAQRDFVMRLELCRKNVRVLAAKVRKSREQTPDEKLFEAIFGGR